MAVLVRRRLPLLPESRNPNPGPWDLVSVSLSLAGMVGVVYAMKEAATHGFDLASSATAVLGAAALDGFVRRQLGCRSRCWTCGCSGTARSAARCSPTC